MYHELVGGGFVVSILGSAGGSGHRGAFHFQGARWHTGLGSRHTCLHGPALSSASCMTLYKSLNLTKPWFLHLLNQNSDGAFSFRVVVSRE